MKRELLLKCEIFDLMASFFFSFNFILFCLLEKVFFKNFLSRIKNCGEEYSTTLVLLVILFLSPGSCLS